MGLKKYVQLMALMALPIFILIVGSLEGQYLGSQRPWTGQQSADSLGKKADTKVTNQLQAELDSTQDSLDVVYADVDANRTSIDSVADSLAAVLGRIIDKSRFGTDADLNAIVDGDSLYLEFIGNAGGGVPAIDTTFYDYVIGWSNTGTFPGDYSNAIDLLGLNDSLGGDTLVWCIRQLEAGGNILILSGDSLHVYAGDSLTATEGDTITGLVRINGLGKHQSIITGVDNASSVPGGLFFREAFNGGKLVFKDLGIIWTSAAEVPDHYGAVITFARNLHAEFDNCFLFRKAVTASWITATGTDSSLVYNDCEVDEWMAYYQSSNYRWFIVHNNCKGYIYYDNAYYSNPCKMYKFYNNCDFETRIFGGADSYQGPLLFITGCTFRQREGLTAPLMYRNGQWARIQGSTFWFASTNTSNNFVEIWYGAVTGCTFYDGGVNVQGGYASIQGCHFLSGSIGVDVDQDYVSIQGCRFKSNTTAIDIAAGADSCVVLSNVGAGNTTNINGTPRTDSDNHWF